jgi:voltage-gated potassium channel
MRRGRWSWTVRDHVVLLNSPAINPDRYFERLVAGIRASREFCQASMLPVTRDFPEGLPLELRKLGVVHRHGHAAGPKHLEATAVAHAAVVVVLAERAHDERSDGVASAILHRLSDETGCRARVVAECVADANRGAAPRRRRR